MAVEQANDRSPAVGSANLQPLTLFQLHTQPLFRVDAAIGNLNDRVVGLIGMPLLPGSPELQSGGNAMKIAIAFLADAQQVIGIGLEKRTIVLTAADIGAKGIVIHDPHSPLRSIARREGNPPQHGINGHFVFLRVIPPVRQVGSDNVCSVYRLPVDSALAWRRRRQLPASPGERGENARHLVGWQASLPAAQPFPPRDRGFYPRHNSPASVPRRDACEWA